MSPKPRNYHRFYPSTSDSVWRSMDLIVNVVCKPDGTSFINTFWNGAPQTSHQIDERLSLPQALHYLATLYELEKGD